MSGNFTKCDLRLPTPLYDQIQSIALAHGAKVHHISKKPEMSSTVLKLIVLGIKAYELSDTLSDNLSDNLSDKVSDNLSDQNKVHQLNADIEYLRNQISNLNNRLEKLEGLIESTSETDTINETDLLPQEPVIGKFYTLAQAHQIAANAGYAGARNSFGKAVSRARQKGLSKLGFKKHFEGFEAKYEYVGPQTPLLLVDELD